MKNPNISTFLEFPSWTIECKDKFLQLNPKTKLKKWTKLEQYHLSTLIYHQDNCTKKFPWLNLCIVIHSSTQNTPFFTYNPWFNIQTLTSAKKRFVKELLAASCYPLKDIGRPCPRAFESAITLQPLMNLAKYITQNSWQSLSPPHKHIDYAWNSTLWAQIHQSHKKINFMYILSQLTCCNNINDAFHVSLQLPFNESSILEWH